MRKILVVTRENADTGSMYKIEDWILEKIRQNAPGFEVDKQSLPSNDGKADALGSDVDKKLSEAEILIAVPFVKLTEENTRNLKWLHLTSAGANTLPEFLANSKLLVTSSSGVHPIPITEHVLAFMLMFARGIDKAFRIQIKDKKWLKDYEFYKPFELLGKKVLIVGMGKIGERLGEVCKTLGMEVEGLVRDVNKPRSTNIPVSGIEKLKEKVNAFNFIVNCLPGTKYTEKLFDTSVFNNFNSASYFINIGRGTTVDEQALIEALKSGKLAGAGLDVFEIEPLPETSPLWDMENVIITSHISGWTPKYFERVTDIFIENLKAYLRDEKLPNLVDKKLGY